MPILSYVVQLCMLQVSWKRWYWVLMSKMCSRSSLVLSHPLLFSSITCLPYLKFWYVPIINEILILVYLIIHIYTIISIGITNAIIALYMFRLRHNFTIWLTITKKVMSIDGNIDLVTMYIHLIEFLWIKIRQKCSLSKSFSRKFALKTTFTVTLL